MEKYDAEYDVFDEFIRCLLTSFHLRYDAEAWLALQEKLDKKLEESGGAEGPFSELTGKHNSGNSDVV